MKKLLLLSILLVACDQSPQERVLSGMNSPVTVQGKTCMTRLNIDDKEFITCTILLIDADGDALTVGGDTYMGMALSSRNVGDTIK